MSTHEHDHEHDDATEDAMVAYFCKLGDEAERIGKSCEFDGAVRRLFATMLIRYPQEAAMQIVSSAILLSFEMSAKLEADAVIEKAQQ